MGGEGGEGGSGRASAIAITRKQAHSARENSGNLIPCDVQEKQLLRTMFFTLFSFFVLFVTQKLVINVGLLINTLRSLARFRTLHQHADANCVGGPMPCALASSMEWGSNLKCL